MLKASGVALGLPLLESMNPALGNMAEKAPNRLVFMCTTLGLYGQNLWPKTDGRKYESTKYLDLLKEHRDDFTLFSGLQHEDQTGRQPHDSEQTWLTAARMPGMAGFRNSISVDQVAANQMGQSTRYPSITLGTAQARSQSFTKNGVMIPAETSPAKLFARMFLKGKPAEMVAQRRKLIDGKSILDELQSQAKTIRKQTSASDNHLLEDYFESVRQSEKNISAAQAWLERPKPKVDREAPQDIDDLRDLIGRARLLVDLVPLIVQTDSSRVISIMIQDHFVVPKIEGVTGNHHHLSHHGRDPAKITQLTKIESEIVECFESLLTGLKSHSEGETTLLDRTSVLFGSNLGNANAHEAKNLPIFLAGGGFQHGRFTKHSNPKPLSNLFVTLLDRAGVEIDAFGQSTGSLDVKQGPEND